MCDPVTALIVAGATVGAYGEYQQGQYAAAQGRENARVANMQAEDSLRRGAIEEDQQRSRMRAILGSQRAAMGANGTTASGTNLGLLAETAQFGEVDALTIRNNAAREAFGYKNQAAQELNAGRNAKRAGTMGAFSTLLTGGAQAFGSFKKAKGP